MGAKGWVLSLVAATTIVLAVLLVVSALETDEPDTDEPDTTTELAAGQIYSIRSGDPLDVVYEIDESGMGCTSLRGRSLRVGGVTFGTGPRCFDPKTVEEGGTYWVVLPSSTADPALVVGVLPHGATGAIVSGIGWSPAWAEVRGRWFLASLEPAVPDESNLEDFRVRFKY